MVQVESLNLAAWLASDNSSVLLQPLCHPLCMPMPSSTLLQADAISEQQCCKAFGAVQVRAPLLPACLSTCLSTCTGIASLQNAITAAIPLSTTLLSLLQIPGPASNIYQRCHTLLTDPCLPVALRASPAGV